MKFCDNLHGGLNKLAELLQVCGKMQQGLPALHSVGSITCIDSTHSVGLIASNSICVSVCRDNAHLTFTRTPVLNTHVPVNTPKRRTLLPPPLSPPHHPHTPLGGTTNLPGVPLQVERIGPQHQAGSDSLLTSLAFIKLAQQHFNGLAGVAKHMGVLYGLGTDGDAPGFRAPE